jgi:hypothetical protein
MSAENQSLIGAIKQQRVGVASSIIAAIALIGVIHAPVVPVAVGCLVALTFLVLRARSRLSSGK